MPLLKLFYSPLKWVSSNQFCSHWVVSIWGQLIYLNHHSEHSLQEFQQHSKPNISTNCTFQLKLPRLLFRWRLPRLPCSNVLTVAGRARPRMFWPGTWGPSICNAETVLLLWYFTFSDILNSSINQNLNTCLIFVVFSLPSWDALSPRESSPSPDGV